MADASTSFLTSSVGRRIARALGLPRPAVLRRHEPGQTLVSGEVLVAGHGEAPVAAHLREVLTEWDVPVATRASTSVAGVVVDLTEIAGPEHLETLRATVGPALRTLAPSGRVIVVGRPPDEAGHDVALAAARRALEGITRSLGKEMRSGGTANLVLVHDGAEGEVDASIRFLLSGRSAYVSGQVITVSRSGHPEPVAAPTSWDRPLTGRVAVVTGAARGIGRAVARTLARDGATIVAVDVPAAGGPLAEVTNSVAGSALQVDVTAGDAGRKILDHARSRHGGMDIIVHNAGITRDRLLANTEEERWRSVLEVNLTSILRMNETLLQPDGIRDGGHMVCVSSVAGIAGNRGQTNYAASKAGVIGMVRALGADGDLRRRGVTVNAVAPGFIETEMTAAMPFAAREIGRRLNSLAQGGLPIDVAETIGWLCWDANAGVSGNVVRVCGQSWLGA